MTKPALRRPAVLWSVVLGTTASSTVLAFLAVAFALFSAWSVAFRYDVRGWLTRTVQARVDIARHQLFHSGGEPNQHDVSLTDERWVRRQQRTGALVSAIVFGVLSVACAVTLVLG